MAECVTVYMKESCPYSLGLIRELERDGVTYVKYDVERDTARLKEMLRLNGGRRAVPTVVWPDRGVEVGFRGQ